MTIVMGIWVSIVSVVGISISMVGKSVSVSVVSVESISISLGLGSGSGLSISGPLAIVVSIVVGIWVSIVSMMGIAKSMAIHSDDHRSSRHQQMHQPRQQQRRTCTGRQRQWISSFCCLQARGFS